MGIGKAHETKLLFEFGAFRLDASERILVREGRRIPLAPKAFDTLLMLVQSSGHVLTKDELIRSLWPDSFVEENILTQHISALRRVLGQGSTGQEYIETVPKLGYRFLVEVREIGGNSGASVGAGAGEIVVAKRTRRHIVVHEEQEEEELPDEASPLAGAANRQPEAGKGQGVPIIRGEKSQRLAVSSRWKHMSLVVAAALAALLVASSALVRRFRDPQPGRIAPGGARTLAVLPLRNLKPSAETDFLSMALTDAIINRLGYVREIRVEPLAAVARYRSTDADPRQIARELNVENVLTGSYAKDGDDLRVTMELIGPDDGGGPRRQNTELKYDKLFRVQDWVAVSVIHSMGLQLRPEEGERLNKGVPNNPAAYEYYLRGLDSGFRSDWEGAVKLLEKSVALEPGNAMAWDELGNVYLGYSAVQGGPADYADKGWEAFRRAIKLDPGNRFVVDEMAFQLLEHNQAERAIPLLQESIRENPTDSFAHWYLSEAYRYGGALERSVVEGELALRLNPNVSLNTTFNTYLYVGRYKEFLDSLPRDEKNARAVFYRGLAYYYLKDTARAVEEFDRALALDPALLHSKIGQGFACAVRREKARGLELIKSIESSGGDDGEMLYKMAQAFAQLGDAQSAVRMLRRSINLGFYPHAYFASDPLMEPARNEPEYSEVMELARQRQEEFVSRWH